MSTPTIKRQSGSEIVAALEVAYEDIRANHPELPEVVWITGSGLAGGGGKWAHFWRDRWEDKRDDASEPDKRAEMFMAGERLACGAELTLQSMLHEAAHALAAVRGLQDTSRQHRYHNKTFVKMAKELGLEYPHETPDSTTGFSAVVLREETKAKYAETIKRLDASIKTYLNDPLLAALGLVGGDGTGSDGAHRIPKGLKPTKPKARNNTKYVCECAKPRVLRMAPKTFEVAPITCGACGEEFREAE